MTIEHTAHAPVLTEQPPLARQDTLLARAAGYDVAAAATNTGLVISAQAIDTGRSYDTRLSYLTADGQSSEVAGGRVDAASAPQALTLLIGNERRSGGLDLVDIAALKEQLTQLDAALHASQPKTTHVVEDVDAAPTGSVKQQVTVTSDDPAQRWAGVARGAGGQAVLEDRQILVGGHREVDDMLANHWHAADALAEQLGLDRDVRATLFQTFERWDGKGVPSGSQGEEILLASRIVNLADVLEVFHRVAGEDGAIAVARERSGTQFAPNVVDVVVTEAPVLFSELDAVTNWDAVIAAEPGLARLLSEDELDTALEAIADFIDIKSPFTLGHSRGVADLAACAADVLQLGADAMVHVRRAGLVHDIGRLGVSNAVWDKAGS